MRKTLPLKDIAKVVRSKNAGPFEITFDIIFKTREDYEAVKASGVITKQLFSELYDVPTQHIITFVYFDAAHAIKATIPRAGVVLAQTPQGFRYDVIKKVFDEATADGFMGTDEASLAVPRRPGRSKGSGPLNKGSRPL